MSRPLTQQRCLNHDVREAVARCPECEFFYCRECITEHDDRVICAGCLRKLTVKQERRKLPLAALARLGAALVGLVTAWMLFYSLGSLISAIPTEFHNASLWEQDFMDYREP